MATPLIFFSDPCIVQEDGTYIHRVATKQVPLLHFRVRSVYILLACVFFVLLNVSWQAVCITGGARTN